MEIVIGLIVITLGIYSVSWIHELRSTVNKQQEQIVQQHQYIDTLLSFNKTQSVINKDLADISKDIAKKVMSIEERVDKYTKIVE